MSPRHDPGQLVWPVKEFARLMHASAANVCDPCQLVWQVKKFAGLPGKLALLPDEPAGGGIMGYSTT